MNAMNEVVPGSDPRKRNSAVLCGAGAGLISLALRWMTIHEVELSVQGGLSSEFTRGLGFLPSTVEVTAWNGHIFGGALPLWGLALLVVLANLVLLARRSRHLYVPEALPLVLALVAAGFMLVPLLTAGSMKATLGPGWLLCFAASLVPLVWLFRVRGQVAA